MNDPIYHLEGVVKTKDDAEDFEGPLNLILQLLSKNKTEIRDVSISALLDQYLAYLDEMAQMDLEIASEFVAMASHLMYIKTKVLLAGDEEVSELEQLLSSLESLKARDVYGQIKQITDAFAEMFRQGAGLLSKPQEPIAVDKQYRYEHNRMDLLQALTQVTNREILPDIVISQLPIPKRIVYSIDEKADELVQRLRTGGAMRVRELFSDCGSRSEMVATFLVILELCRSGNVLLAGGDDQMTITYSQTAEPVEIGDEQDGYA
jgi:segregation and condensation protein A